MFVRSYGEVRPSTYAGGLEGVELREMITYIAPNEPHCFIADTPVQFICVIPTKNVCKM